MNVPSDHSARRSPARLVLPAFLLGGLLLGGMYLWARPRVDQPRPSSPEPADAALPVTEGHQLAGVSPPPEVESLRERAAIDTSGFGLIIPLEAWEPNASLDEIKRQWIQWGDGVDRELEQARIDVGSDVTNLVAVMITQASKKMADGKAGEAHDVLQEARVILERHGGQPKQAMLASVIYFQGVAALRRGEDDNCIMCRGESSCILPINEAAVHENDTGSRLAILYFTEYLDLFPDDLAVQWLLNLAHMTLGEYPDHVDARHRLSLDNYLQSEFDIGRFRDIGDLVGCNRFNQAGGAIMDDFDGDGLLDLVVTSFDVKQGMSIYRNEGSGRFQEVTREAGVEDQLGGLYCVQADYNNDGLPDILVVRGAWVGSAPIRPTLLRNDGDLRFTDVTEEVGLIEPVNSITAQWADYDNDGWLDLFICCERQAHRLYRNRGDGTFEEVAAKARLVFDGQQVGKGCAWIDFDNDGYPDLFINYLAGSAQLYRNNRDGTFSNATSLLGRGGPRNGFSCWAWDFNNDGWLDIFATCYQRTLQDVVRGLEGEPHELGSNRLFLNLEGQGFRDVTKDAGLDMVFSTMGSNFADFDNDGYLDFYLGTGEPDLATLVPNRMFRNVGGTRFAEITTSAGVGHLQKGHSVACGDWNRDGNIDLFVQTGGVVDGDKFHNVLFQNPGHGNAWISIKLTGERTNRSAIGARIKVVTSGDEPLTVHRHVSSGSSFGANPLEQLIGLGGAAGIQRLEVHWPTSGTTQVFHDVPINQSIRISEFEEDYQAATVAPIGVPDDR